MNASSAAVKAVASLLMISACLQMKDKVSTRNSLRGRNGPQTRLLSFPRQSFRQRNADGGGFGSGGGAGSGTATANDGGLAYISTNSSGGGYGGGFGSTLTADGLILTGGNAGGSGGGGANADSFGVGGVSSAFGRGGG
jgi:hypothetical protein